VLTDVASVESAMPTQLRITMVLMQLPTRNAEHGPSIPLMVIRVRPRLRMQQRNTGDHALSARRRPERVVASRTDQARDMRGDSKP
jgi:hypothetical protein